MNIFIENYQLVSKHGYYKEEHFKEQRFLVSVNCELKEKTLNIDDNLSKTFNYEIIRNIIKEVIMGEHKKLLETLAEEILEKISKYDQVKKVRIKITKPDIWSDCTPGVELEVIF